MEHTPEHTRILVSGGGIAGLALAYWLRRYGFRPTVVERAAALRGGGQAVDLRGAARDVAERMGLMPDIRSAHTGTRGMAYVDRRGRRLAYMDTESFGDSGGAIADIEILRSDLVRILLAAAQDGVEYLFDDSITALTETPDGVEVGFERSAPRVFDLVVGADGTRSNVRRLAFGPDDGYVTDGGHYLGIFATTTPYDLDGWQVMYAMPGRLAGLYPTGSEGDARAMLFFRSPPLDVDRRDLDAQRRVLADAFAGQGWEVPRLIEAMWQAPDLYVDRAAKVTMDRWSSGRVVLLGDASFAGSVGMGTSMALVGAYVLAGELAVARDHRAAFTAYERALRDYVTACQKPLPGGERGFLPPTRLEIWLRIRCSA
ncbi:MAG: NAD(P)-binding protein [Streptosporangiales bacterium]|nr:NAD(P)-binding protein [Streptosporangiales bacterium]